METARRALDPVDDSGHYACLLARAEGSSEIVAAVRDYLAAWSRPHIVNLQRVDGGWAPFDDHQQPLPVYRAADVQKIRDAVHAQCASLRGAGVAASHELLELDLFLALACEKLGREALASPRAGGAHRQPESRLPR
jgi:hypothetical protein